MQTLRLSLTPTKSESAFQQPPAKFLHTLKA